MEHINQFLTELCTDPFKQLAYQQDPEGTAAAAGLKPWAFAALKPGVEPGAWQKCVWGFDPGPDPLEDPN